MRSKNTDLMNEIKKFAEEYYLEYWKSPLYLRNCRRCRRDEGNGIQIFNRYG